jgi:hypothetical protein
VIIGTSRKTKIRGLVITPLAHFPPTELYLEAEAVIELVNHPLVSKTAFEKRL